MAASTSRNVRPPRIHHLYLVSGSGVAMGLPMPPPGVGLGALDSVWAPPPAIMPWGLIPGCCWFRGICPSPETVNEMDCPGRTFLAMLVVTRGSSCTFWKSAPEVLAKFMLLGTY